jgi:hypothetical protein
MARSRRLARVLVGVLNWVATYIDLGLIWLGGALTSQVDRPIFRRLDPANERNASSVGMEKRLMKNKKLMKVLMSHRQIF